MSALAERAYAKLNLALHVRGRRPDGYHEIETVFAFCEDGDDLVAEPSDSLTLTIDGPLAAGLHVGDNLVLRAARMLGRAARGSRGATLRLTKRLPVAAGLGGGSADAAAALRLLDRMWDANLDQGKLDSLAADLGADVRACLYSRSARGTGRGERLKLVELGLSGTPVLLINPRVELATADVFAAWDGVDRGPLGDWRMGRNDLEQAAMSLVPQIRAVMTWLSAQDGAGLVRMSGSGATCFGLFENQLQRDRAADAVPREWWRLATRLR